MTWQTTFKLAGRDATVLNDDNDGLRANRRPDDVITGQALPQIATDAQGNLAVIWYDTRRDPANVLVDVFGTVSTDGGQTFSPNFRLTDKAFNANDGRFTSVTGATEYYMGDLLGLTLDHGTAYAAWTDTRGGHQDVAFTRYGLNPVPAPLNDRFEPNDTPDLSNSPTRLGRVIKRTLPKLEVAGTDQDWFHFQSVATGTLTASVLQTDVGGRLRLELFDATGTIRLAEGSALLNEQGQVTGQQVVFPSEAGRFYQVRVTSITASETRYALTLQALTEDLGLAVYGQPAGSLNAGDEAVFALTAAAIGSLGVKLTPGANSQGHFKFNLLHPDTLAVLASGQIGADGLQATLPVRSGQGVLIHVFGDAGTAGDFTLELVNLDQYATPANSTFFYPVAASPSQAAIADFNDDGNPDVAVSQIGTDTVSVLLGNGDGTFQAPRQFLVGAFVQGNPSTLSGLGNYRRDVVASDVDGDGNLDVIVGNHGSSDVSILLGRGDGTFEVHRRSNATGAPYALDAGFIDDDDNPDLVVVDSTGNPSQVGGTLLGRGDGSFQLLSPIDLPPGQPNRTNAVRIADLDGDGNNDLVTIDIKYRSLCVARQRRRDV